VNECSCKKNFVDAAASEPRPRRFKKGGRENQEHHGKRGHEEKIHQIVLIWEGSQSRHIGTAGEGIGCVLTV